MNWQETFYNLDTSPYSNERLQKYKKRLFKRFGRLWNTKDGRIIPVRLMRDSHIRNAFMAWTRTLLECVRERSYGVFERQENSYWMLYKECKNRGMSVFVHPDIQKYSDQLDTARFMQDMYPMPHDVEDMPF